MIEQLEEKLKDVILQTVEFVVDGKPIKQGKIRVYNTKQFFIKFKLENGDESKDMELPYPYRLEKIGNSYLFDYCLSAFCPPTELVFYKMKLLNKENASKLHDNHLWLVPVT